MRQRAKYKIRKMYVTAGRPRWYISVRNIRDEPHGYLDINLYITPTTIGAYGTRETPTGQYRTRKLARETVKHAKKLGI